MCVGGGEGEEDQNSSISLHVSEMFKLLGAFIPEMPITLSFLDSVLYEIQNKKKKKKEREKTKILATYYSINFWPLLIQLKDIFY